jgi:hypothetical protein
VRVCGEDGKRYPASPLAPNDRLRLIGRVHYLAHAEGLSVRGIVRRLEVEGVTRSVGSVSTYLTAFRCPECSGGSDRTPEHRRPS